MARIVCLLLSIIFGLAPVWAEDRALIIGVGKFRKADFPALPGIDVDVELMRRTAQRLGFSAAQTKVLHDDNATLAAVEQAFREWLTVGVSANDRVLIYVSGHGTLLPDRNGDEDDGSDEALVMHDVDYIRDPEGHFSGLQGVLVDDEFQELLKALPSRRILILIDACHSGTATKSFTLPSKGQLTELDAREKFLEYPGMPLVSKGNFMVAPRTRQPNYVVLSAARDDQKAIATFSGSLFTLALDKTLRQAASAGRTLTLAALRDAIAEFIEINVPPERQFQPQLNGNDAMFELVLNLTATESDYSPVWESLIETARRGKELKLVLNQDRFVDGDIMTIAIDAPAGGYLNVVNVGPDDQPTVLFPNAYRPDNRIDAGLLEIPTPEMEFDLVAGEPYGSSLIVAFLTEKPIDFYKSGYVLYQADGKPLDLRAMSPRGELAMRNFTVRYAIPFRAGYVDTRVCPVSGCLD